MEGKDIQTGMKRNDYGNRRHNRNDNGTYNSSGNLRTSSQSNDIQNIKERSPRSRVNSETSQSSKDFITPLQSNNVSSYYTNMSNQIQNYKNEKKDSINILPNSTNTNFSTILNHNTDYSLPETTKFCISCNSNINIKGKIGSDKKSCICKDNERQEAKM
uniref:Uncharacterized protein n=1 Tax=Parastrongyloides trichosuri TaxID=131310 RepID=A0A0N4ZV77_PARTI